MAVLRRVPFTIGVAALILGLAIATGTLWSPLESKDWFADVAYGPQALADHRWWTFATGALFALAPWQYPVVIGFFVLLSGLAEWRLGTKVAAVCVVLGQLVGVVGGCALVLLLAETGWGWAVRISDDLDLGFSAGGMCAAMIASAGLRRRWRGRVRLALVGYTLTSLTFLGFLYDVEHLVAVVVGLAAGPWVVGRRPTPLRTVLQATFTRRDLRLIAAGFFWWSAALTLIAQVVDREGPFGQIGGDPESWWWVLVQVAADLVVAQGLVRGRRTWWWVAAVITALSVVLVLVSAGFVLAGELDNSGLLWLSLVLDGLGLVVLLWGRRAFRNPGRRGLRKAGPQSIGALATDAHRARARALLADHGSGNRLAWMTTWPQNSWWFGPEDGAVAYRLTSGVAIGLCDPIAGERHPHEVADAFVAAARDGGTTPCLFSASPVLADWARERGWLAVQVAEEAIVDLAGLEFRGKKWQDVRSAFNQAEKQGIEVRLHRLAEAPRSIRVQVAAICDEWVHDKKLPEMGFTLGGLEEAKDPDVWIAIAVDQDMTVHGVTSWMPIHGTNGQVEGWTLDLMRRLPGGFRYAMELLIAGSCQIFRDDGYALVSLSGAPLAHARGGDEDERGVVDTMLDRLGEVLEPYYGFRSLQAFKAKFQPRYEPLYLLVEDEAVLPLAGVAIGRAYLADATLGQLLSLTVKG
ncbi:bifunctional lysylphosphatidylglycerol flippase/synthetase MprF [Pimelobacter sp. 30-1]|uniref:bifunctional lysylphosphatidylglycerol flippase/synthetase MprF n=1 Tax=Pimelobacter sp. 30-1 TaxID=2004991 RepID=UPI001C059EB7|nr:DUF2156 domain-containing protein [Pimelobacter sp. 30-1]MBU2697714.1 hypothetical protein [Pimelobacter sp. 30-1]